MFANLGSRLYSDLGASIKDVLSIFLIPPSPIPMSAYFIYSGNLQTMLTRVWPFWVKNFDHQSNSRAFKILMIKRIDALWTTYPPLLVGIVWEWHLMLLKYWPFPPWKIVSSFMDGPLEFRDRIFSLGCQLNYEYIITDHLWG